MCGLGYHEERRARQGRGRCALSSPSAMPRATTTDHHPATRRGPRRPPPTPARWPTSGMIPRDQDEVLVALGDRRVKLTNLRKLLDRKSTRLNSSHGYISYAVFCLKKKKKQT